MLGQVGRIIVALIVLSGLSNAIYLYKHSGKIWQDGTKSLIEDFSIAYNSSDGQFPDEFYIELDKFDVDARIKFIKSPASPGHSDDGYIIDPENGKVVNLNLPKLEKYEHYSQENGLGFATLVKNLNSNDNSKKFRMLGTIYNVSSEDIAFDIYPAVDEKATRKRRSISLSQGEYDSENNHHIISKRNAQTQNDPVTNIYDYAIPPADQNIPKILNAKANKALTKPINLYVELLLVVEPTLISDFQTMTKITNTTILYSIMRIYYAHLIKGVNQRYSNSLSADTDMRINVVFSNILFLTQAANLTWLTSSRTYNGKQVQLAYQTLNSFTNFMNSLSSSLNFDVAFALMDRDIFSDDTSQSDARRSGVIGYAFVGATCGSYRYGIIEDTASFYNTEVIAHELGHVLGAQHDGTSPATSCSADNKNVMAPSYGFSESPSYLKFSSCSINQFKSFLLTSTLDAISTSGSCLSNTPTNLLVEVSYSANVYAGAIWSPDDQCRMYFGSNASFCQSLSSSMCSGMYCRYDPTDYNCYGLSGGATDGTTCGSGQICLNQICTSSASAPKGKCLYEEQLVSQIDINNYYNPNLVLPSTIMNCSSVIDLIASTSRSVFWACDYAISQKCCAKCAKYQAISCRDAYSNCGSYASLCNTGNFTINGNLVPVKNQCPITCKNCPSTPLPLQCSSAGSLCQNGGSCTSAPTSSDGLFAFKCVCPAGYTGELCEIKTPCTPNPCQNGGVCQQLGSLSYMCLCPPRCSGYNCTTCGSSTGTSTTRRTVSTPTTRPGSTFTTTTIKPTTKCTCTCV